MDELDGVGTNGPDGVGGEGGRDGGGDGGGAGEIAGASAGVLDDDGSNVDGRGLGLVQGGIGGAEGGDGAEAVVLGVLEADVFLLDSLAAFFVEAGHFDGGAGLLLAFFLLGLGDGGGMGGLGLAGGGVELRGFGVEFLLLLARGLGVDAEGGEDLGMKFLEVEAKAFALGILEDEVASELVGEFLLAGDEAAGLGEEFGEDDAVVLLLPGAGDDGGGQGRDFGLGRDDAVVEFEAGLGELAGGVEERLGDVGELGFQLPGGVFGAGEGFLEGGEFTFAGGNLGGEVALLAVDAREHGQPAEQGGDEDRADNENGFRGIHGFRCAARSFGLIDTASLLVGGWMPRAAEGEVISD